MKFRWRATSRVLAVLALAVSFAAAAPALAQLGASVNEGLAFGTIVGWGTQDLRVTIMRVIQILFGFLGVVAVLIILYAGWLWMTAAGNPQQIDRAKRILVEAVIGLLLIFGAFAIVSFVIRSLVSATGPVAPGVGGGCPGGSYWCGATSSCLPIGSPCGVVGGNICRVQSVSPVSPPRRVKNSVVRVNFNLNPDGSAQNPANFMVQLADPGATGVAGAACGLDLDCLSGECGGSSLCEESTVAGTITTSGRRVEFRPLDGRFCLAFPGVKCFRSNQKYQVTVQPPLECGGVPVSCDPAVFCSDPAGVCGALGSACGTGGFCRSQCAWFFETNDIVDLRPPAVNLSPGNICADVNQHLRASYSDDYGVDLVTFDNLTNPAIIWPDYDTPAGSEAAGTADITVDMTGYPLGPVRVRAEAFDFDDHTARSERTYQVRAGHCCNAIQDVDETGLNCGGAECGACSGAACDIDVATPLCQPNDSVCAFACSTTSCTCVDPPFIDYVSPARDVNSDNDGDPADPDGDQFNDDRPFGAPGNLVTIIGRNFGPYAVGASKVEFTCAGVGCWVEARLAQAVNVACLNTWAVTQIVVEVPAGPPDTLAIAVDGPLRVTTSDGLTDTTDTPVPARSTERGILDFDVDPAANLPGICSLDPTSGEFKAAVIVHGIRLDRGGVTTDDFVKFGGHLAPPGTAPTWSASIIDGVLVPSIVPGPVRAWVELDAGTRISNTLGFRVQPGADHPVILDFNPKTAAVNDYLSIIGANFGARRGRGTVKFCTNAACTAQGDGNFVFPNQCGSDVWTSSRIIVKVPPGAFVGASPITVVTDAGLPDSSTDANGPNVGNLTVTAGAASPGICKLQPDNGPAGEARVTVYGERFVAVSTAQFTASAGTVAGTPPAVTLSGDPSQADTLRARVPSGAVTGDVRVQNPGPPVQDSNPLLFTVSDCRSQAACTGGQECCAVGPYAGSCAPAGSCGGVTLQSAYRWHFVTGRAGPRVIQQCTRTLDCRLGGYSSPTPPPDSEEVPVNAKISASIDRPLDPATVTLSTVKVERCGVSAVFDPANCDLTVNHASAVSPLVDWNYRGVSAHRIDVDVTPVAAGQPFVQNTWYRVTLTRDIRSPSGEQLLGNDPITGNFVWKFKTRNDPAPGRVGCVGCSPERSTIYGRGNTQGLTGEAWSSENACVLLDLRASTWQWTTTDPLRVTISGSTNDQETATGQAQSPGTDVWVTIPAQTAEAGTCRVAVELATPVVIGQWPDCNSACVNAQIGARFSLPMDATGGGPNSLTSTNNVKLYVCGLDYTCPLSSSLLVTIANLVPAASDTELAFDPAASHNGLDTNSDGIPDIGRLIPGVYYRVVLDADTDGPGADTGLASPEGKGLGRLNFDADPVVAGLDAYSWVFQVREDFNLCVVGRVDLSPATVTAYPPSRVPYAATPRGSPDECNAAGQRLNAYSYDWGWSSSAATVANIFGPTFGCGNMVREIGEECDDGNQTNGGGCSDSCLAEADPDAGNTVRPGTPAAWACGNGLVENNGNGLPENGEEQCDDGNRTNGDGCSATCLLEGSRFNQSVCGDGIVGPGEACESCGLTGSVTPIWRGSCASSDFAHNRRPAPGSVSCSARCATISIAGNTQAAPVSVCGNRRVEAGEECDTGEYSGDSSDGCTDSCLFTGSLSTRISPYQLAEAVAPGTATITAQEPDSGQSGNGAFTVPSPGGPGGGGPFRILSQQPSGTTPACLNELIVVRFSREPDIASVRSGVIVRENTGIGFAIYSFTNSTTQITQNGTVVTIAPNGARWARNAVYEVDFATNAGSIFDRSVPPQSLVCPPGECQWTFTTGTLVCRASAVNVQPAFAQVPPNASQNFTATLAGPFRPAQIVGGVLTRLGAGSGVPTIAGALGCSANVFVCVNSLNGTDFTVSANDANTCAGTVLPLPDGFLATSRIDSSRGVVYLGCGVGLDFSATSVTRNGGWVMDLDPATRPPLTMTENFSWRWVQLDLIPPALAIATPPGPTASGPRSSILTVPAVAPWTPFVGARQADITARFNPDNVSGRARFVVGNLCQAPYRSGTRYNLYPLQLGVDTLGIGHFDGAPRISLGNGRTLEPSAQAGLSYGDGLTDGGGRRLVQAVTIDAAADVLEYPADGLVNPQHGTVALWVSSSLSSAATRALLSVGPAASDVLTLGLLADAGSTQVTLGYGGVAVLAAAAVPFSPAPDEWHLIVASWEIRGAGVFVSVSLDGQAPVTSSGAATPFTVDATTRLRLGQDAGTMNHAGVDIDELEISRTVFDPEEIEARYQAVAADCISGAANAGAPQVSACSPDNDSSTPACDLALPPGVVVQCSSPLVSATFDQPMDRATLLRRSAGGDFDAVRLCLRGQCADPANNLITRLEYNPIVHRLAVSELKGAGALDDASQQLKLGFNAPGDLADASGRRNNASCSGARCPTWTSDGKVGGAYRFDGVDDFLTLGNPPDLNQDFGQLTVAFWMYANPVTDGRRDAGLVGKGTTFYGLTYDTPTAAGELYFYTGPGGGEGDVSVHVSDSAWHHVTAVFRGLEVVKNYLYIDGVLAASDEWNTLIGPPPKVEGMTITTPGSTGQIIRPFYIGRKDDSGSNVYFDGQIDEVRMWNRALTDREVALLFSSGGFTPGQSYEFMMVGGSNGVTSVTGIPLAADFTLPFQIAADARQCRCDAVRVLMQPQSRYGFADQFSCAGNTCQGDLDPPPGATGNQHVYDAQCYDRGAGQQAASVNYQWRKAYDVNGVVNLSCAVPPCTTAAALDAPTVIATNTFVNGEARVAVVATGVAPTVGRAEQFVDVSNFVCANPWPDPWTFPWRDTAAGFPLGGGAQENKLPYTNFKLFYCRDINQTETANDDLPPVHTPPTVRAASLPKQFLFPLNYFQQTAAIQTIDGVSVKNATNLRGSLNHRTQNQADEICADLAANPGTPDGSDVTYLLTIPEPGHYQVAFEVVHFDPDFEPPAEVSIKIGAGDALQPQRLPSLRGRQIVTYDLGQQSNGSLEVKLWYQNNDVHQSREEEIFAVCRVGLGLAHIKHDVIGVQVFNNPWRLSPATWYASGVCEEAPTPPTISPTDLTGVCFSDRDCLTIGTIHRCKFNVPNRGSAPQSTVVDGYPAIRDGRTIYVGATNLTTAPSGGAGHCSLTQETACTVK